MAIPKVRRNPAMRAPILGWWPVAFVGTLVVYFGRFPSAAVLAAVSVGVYRESLALLALPARLHAWLWRAGAGLAVLVHGLMLFDGPLATGVGLAAPFLLVPLAQFACEGSDGFVRNAGGAQWVMVSCMGFFSFGARLVTFGHQSDKLIRHRHDRLLPLGDGLVNLADVLQRVSHLADALESHGNAPNRFGCGNQIAHHQVLIEFVRRSKAVTTMVAPTPTVVRFGRTNSGRSIVVKTLFAVAVVSAPPAALDRPVAI